MVNLNSCSICRIPVCLVGPTGLGKTSMARAFSEYTRNDVATMYSFHLGTQVDDIFGTFTFKNGKPEIMEGPLTKMLEKGKIFIADEFNLAEDAILQTLSIAFENLDENSSYLIPGINSTIKYDKNFFFIACQNDLSTTGRKRLPYIIEKRLRIFDYPSPDLEDLKSNCKDIINETLEKEEKEDKNVDGMTSKIKRTLEVSHEKLANFMFRLNADKNKKLIGNWSMRNIRKILRRYSLQQFKVNSEGYINVSFELQLVIYILSEIPTNKRLEAFEEIKNILRDTFKMDIPSINDIEGVIKGKPKIKKERINNVDKKFLFKGKSGIEIKINLDGLEELNSLLDTVFYTLFADHKEPINFCGPSCYKTFIAKKLSNEADLINLYSETSIEQLLGYIDLVNKTESKMYYIEKILKILKKEDKLKEYKNIIEDYYNKKKNYEFSKSNSSNNIRENKKLYTDAEKKFNELNEEISKLKIDIQKGKDTKMPDCIIKALESLQKKLFEIEKDNKRVFKDFTSIFKTGILLENILIQSPIILKNLSNLSTAVLERFNDLFNYNPKLTLNEDFCDTFTLDMNPKEINNFSNNFRVISISSLSGIRNLSDAAKSRFTTIYTSEYEKQEIEIAARAFAGKTTIPNVFFEFISEYEKYKKEFNRELSFLDMTKILSIFKKISKKKKDNQDFSLILSIYFALYSNYDNKTKKEEFLDILIKLNKGEKFEKEELNDLCKKENKLQNPLITQDQKLKSEFTEIEIESININKEKNNNLFFTTPFNKLINYIHFSLALHIPLIIEGQIGIGKKTAIKYVANILNLKEIYFSISNTTTVEDLFCKKIPVQNKSGLEFKQSKSKLLDAIDCSRYGDTTLENCIIIIDNLQEASNNVIESLIPVFDETKNKIILPNGDIISKDNNKFHIIAIFDHTSKGHSIKTALPNSIKNTSLLFKCENFIENNNLNDIAIKILGNATGKNEKFYNDFIEIYNYCKENHKKELFNLNDFTKFKMISQIEDINIVDYETLIQILLIYRFTNIDDIKNISSKLGYLLNKNLWPQIDYNDTEKTIQIYPIESTTSPKNPGTGVVQEEEKSECLTYEIPEKEYNEIDKEDLKGKLFTLTPEQRFGLIFLMISIKANIPCIIHGPTASGKSYLIKYFCELLGQNPEIITLNNDSGINILTGQIAIQNEINPKNIEEIKNVIKRCKGDNDEINSLLEKIFGKDEKIDEKKWTPKLFKQILTDLQNKKQNLEGRIKTSVEELEKKLKDELSFLKHLKNEDSPFINALIKGKWVILDGIESAQPELYERLSSLCDIKNKKLNLFEKGPEYEYSFDNEKEEFKINPNFRLFITYNSYEVEFLKKLSPNFMSKCLIYSLPQIDIDCKSSALLLSGLFNYNKTFEKKNNSEVKKNPNPKPDINEEINELNNDSEDEFFERDDNEEDATTPQVEGKREIEKGREGINEDLKKEEFEPFKKIYEGQIYEKKDILDLAIKLANIHQYSKEFAKDKIQKFAGQKNFSGRSLKYVYNSIEVRNYNIDEAIISVFEDCYCNSYQDPDIMKKELINVFIKQPNDYEDVKNYLKRDCQIFEEQYNVLCNIIGDYVEKQIKFKYKTFLDCLDNLLFKDVKKFKETMTNCFEKLDSKNIIDEHYIFFRIIDNIFSKFKKVDKNMMNSEIIKCESKNYKLLRKLIEKNFINFNLLYKNYNIYKNEVNINDIKEPFFELFTKKINLVVDSISLALIYPELENDDEIIKLSSAKKEIIIVIIKLVNHCQSSNANPNYQSEFEIFETLLYLINSQLFIDALSNKYSEETLNNIVNNEMVEKSKKIEEKLNNLKNEDLDLDEEKIEDDISDSFGKWLQSYKDFNKKIYETYHSKNGNDKKIKLDEEFNKLINQLKSLDDHDNSIDRAIRYLENINRNDTSLNNCQEYTKSFIEEYNNKKIENKKKKALIRFDFRPEDVVDNYEQLLLNKYYKNKFNKIIYALIKYNESIKIIENIESIKDKNKQMRFFYKLDRVLNQNDETKKFDNGLDILTKILFENDNSINIQYFKDILISSLYLEYYNIDDSCSYFNIDQIYKEFNEYKNRENIDIEDRKFAYYLSNILPPNYELIIPKINLNAILIMFVQKIYQSKDEISEHKFIKGLIESTFKINPSMCSETDNFKNKIYEFQNKDLTSIDILKGLNDLVNICKDTILKIENINSLIPSETTDQKSIINLLYHKLGEIREKVGGEYLEKLIIIIKGLYDYTIVEHDNKFESDDLFFLKNEEWKKNVGEECSNNKYLIYYLFKNQDIEEELKILKRTDFFKKNDTKKLPIYIHIFRILSSKNNLIFQGRTFNNKTSEIIEKYLIEKIIINKEKNLNWIGLLMDNRKTEEYLPLKIIYIYNYLCKLCETKFRPSTDFSEEYESVLKKVIDYITDFCFQNKIDKIFQADINKKIKENEKIEDILYLTKLKEIIILSIKLKKKNVLEKLINKTKEIFNKVENVKNDFKRIYDSLISAVENDIKEEEDKRKLDEENKKKNMNINSYDDLKENSEKYKMKYNDISTINEDTNINLYSNNIKVLLEKKKNISKYGNFFSSDSIAVSELTFPDDCEKIIIGKDGHEMTLNKDNLSDGIIYLPKKYIGAKAQLINKDAILEERTLKRIEFKRIDEEALKSILIEMRNRNISFFNFGPIKVDLQISEQLINLNKKDQEDSLLYKLKKISNDVVEFSAKINESHNDRITDEIKSHRIVIRLRGLEKIIKSLEELKLTNPKFLNVQKTDLAKTKEVCENYEKTKGQLLNYFREMDEEYTKFNKAKDNLNQDEKSISIMENLCLVNKINPIKNNPKEIDFSPLKDFIFKSKYIFLDKDGKTIKTSYNTFDFHLGNIIPSLYGNSLFSINITSFINKELRAEIVKDSIKDMHYQKSFFVSNFIKKNNPIIIKFIIPDKVIENKEEVETDLDINISDLNSKEIKPFTIKNKLRFNLQPLSVIIYSTKYHFSWDKENKKLILNEGFEEGDSIEIKFKILNFEGDEYESFMNNYSIQSLEGNTMDMPEISLKEKKYFEIKIPNVKDVSKNNFHALFSLYFSKNLIIPIEINSKIIKNDFGLFYYNKYNGEIQNLSINKNIVIYRYSSSSKIDNKYKIVSMNLYFRVQCNKYIDKEDKTKHNLKIEVPNRHELLSFDLMHKNFSFENGITIQIPISISNFSSDKEYKKLYEYISNNRFEIKFSCDGIVKAFEIDFKIENAFKNEKFRLCSVPYFAYINNKFIKIDDSNYDEMSKKNYVYLNYEQSYYSSQKEIKKENNQEFISENEKLIFIFKDILENQGVTIWGISDKDYKIYKSFYESNLEIKEENINKAKEEIKKISEKKKKKDILKFIKFHDNKMDKFINFICNESNESSTIETKVNFITKLSKYIDKEGKLSEDIKNLTECDKIYLPIIYHNIIFKVGNIIKERVLLLENCENKYLKFLGKELSEKFTKNEIKNYNEVEFEKEVKEKICNKKYEETESKRYLFDEFKEPEAFDKLKKPPKIKESQGEIISKEPNINQEILNNHNIVINNLNTIDKVIEMIKTAHNITNNFPFLISHLSKEKANELFKTLYSIFVTCSKYDKNIISEDSIKFCSLFENLCKILLLNKISFNGYDDIAKIKLDKNVQSFNIIEYPKLKSIYILKENKWNTKVENKSLTGYLDIGIKVNKSNEMILQEKLKNEKKVNNITNRQIFRKSIIPDVVKQEKKDKVEQNIVEYDEEQEKYKKKMDKVEEITGDKLKDFKKEKNFIENVVKEMKKPKDPEFKMSFEDLLDKKEELKIQLLENYSKLPETVKDPTLLIKELSLQISIKLIQASILYNIQTEKICAVIAIDCCRNIDIKRKSFHAILAFGMINCFNALEIPYSIVLFADYKFIFTIKDFNTPHDNQIYKLVLDCIMIQRYSTRISEACYYINKKLINPQKSNRKIFLISNGLDPKLNYGEYWFDLFSNEKDKYCFCFIQPELNSPDMNRIKEIWENFVKETGIDVLIIKDIDDIINGKDYIYSKFGQVLSEKAILSNDEIQKAKIESINNIDGPIYQPRYEEKYIINENTKESLKIIENILENYSDNKKEFYILNEPHKPSNINSKFMEKDIQIKNNFKINGDQTKNNLSNFDIEGLNLD